MLARVALAGSGARVVFTAHGWAFSGRGGVSGTAYAGAERAVAPLTDAIVCVSAWDRGPRAGPPRGPARRRCT